MVTMGGVDLSRVATVRVNLQDALDAAALAAARSTETTDAGLTDVGTKALRANLQNYPEIQFSSATFTLSMLQQRDSLTQGKIMKKIFLKIPVLLRQYINLNAKIICFNIDPKFSDCLDGFLVVDTKNIPAEMLEKIGKNL